MATISTVQFPSHSVPEASMFTIEEVQPSELLQYLPTYKVVVCATCKYAIQPNAIARHLKEIHHITRGHRRPFMQHVSKLELDEAENVIDAKAQEFPVPLLPVQDGLMCDSEGCLHLCVSVKRMRTHWLTEHGRSGHAFLDWHPVPLQTFFRGNLLRYFTDPRSVSSQTKNVPHCDLKNSAEYGKSKNNVEAQEIPLSYIAKPSSYPSLTEPDAHLFHHYITSTSLSISNNTITKQLWQTTVPHLAHHHPFLLHGLLALSALHLAHLTPSQSASQIIAASTHQSLAMPLFRSAITSVTLQNSEAVLVFSHLLVLYSFASESQDERLFLISSSTSPNLPSTNEDILPPWLYFLRNGCSLLCDVWDHLESSPVHALADAWDIPITIPSTSTPLLTHLLSILPPSSPSPSTSSSLWTGESTTLYATAAHALSAAFASTSVLGDSFTTWDALRVWPMRLSIEFLELLKGLHPGALVLLAHYCILLKRVRGAWYFEGRAERLLSMILKHLDVEWHWAIRWPLEEIGISSQCDLELES